jgi:drug/metabolite transporter (DMT)-like permease
MEYAAWLWIPVTIWAALAQTLRNAAQRSLTGELGTLGATLVRFLYGLPFAVAWLVAVQAWRGEPLPVPPAIFYVWITVGAVAQIAATAFLLRVMQERNFALGVAYSKTELIQIAVFGLLVLGDPVSAATAFAIACGTVGVLLLSPADKQHPLRALVTGWATRSAGIGLASGACFAFSVIGYRGAALSLEGSSFLLAAAVSLAIAQLIQTVLLGGWLTWRNPAVVRATFRLWRPSLFAGFMGAAASVGWFTAFAIEPGAHVRTLGLIELLFSYAVSRKIFREKLTTLELSGIALLTVGVVVVTLGS